MSRNLRRELLAPPQPPSGFTLTGVQAWWDFTNDKNALVDQNVSNTVGLVKDLTGNGYDLFQPIKELQPAWQGTDGAFFTGTNQMTPWHNVGFVRNATKYYIGGVIRLDTANVGASQRDIIQIGKGTGTTSNRASLALTPNTGGRKLRSVDSVADGTEVTSSLSSAQIVPFIWTSFEIIHDLAAGSIQYFINSGLDSTITGLGTGAIPDTDPLNITVGNLSNGLFPLLGNLRSLIVKTGDFAAGQQAEIQSYLLGRAI